MDKSKNNYLMIGLILLFVVVIVTGAGLCYLSWEQDTEFTGVQVSQAEGWTAEAYAQAKEEGRQELLDYMEKELEANVSAEDILEGLFAGAETEGSEQAGRPIESTTETGVSTETETVVTTEVVVSTEEETESAAAETEALHKGIDVSKYQGDIDWAKVALDGIEYAFVRVGYRGYGDSGSLVVDEKLHQNIKGALAQNIKVGAYFFSQAVTKDEAVEEAELVMKELKAYEITYPVAVYIEKIEDQTARQDKLSKEKRTEICKAFCEKIKEAGYTPMIYGDTKTFTDLIDTDALKDFAFWVYDTDQDKAMAYETAIWQYSHEGKVSGISTETNLSVSYKEW